jgi:predicted RNA-binding protein YlxR (DUF448 family)
VHPKREMMRVVRTTKGSIEIDPGGKQAGRGAYLCRRKGCWETALKRKSLEHALKTTMDDATGAALAAYAQGLPEVRATTDPNPKSGREHRLDEQR